MKKLLISLIFLLSMNLHAENKPTVKNDCAPKEVKVAQASTPSKFSTYLAATKQNIKDAGNHLKNAGKKSVELTKEAVNSPTGGVAKKALGLWLVHLSLKEVRANFITQYVSRGDTLLYRSRTNYENIRTTVAFVTGAVLVQPLAERFANGAVHYLDRIIDRIIRK